ncbi:MAG: hypothetical protein A4S17_13220 [Proteobacteria bacterium HN_bin10]|nr:MAG: hypothetical protein A4S17_13220 [Proteobacteria bacterium HN_bin10]
MNLSIVRSFAIAVAAVLATPFIAMAQAIDAPQAGTDLGPQAPFDRPGLGGRRSDGGPSLCPVPRGQTVLAILDNFCWLMTTHNAETDEQGRVTHTQWWAYFQPGPRFDSESMVGWATIEVVFDCTSRRVLSLTKVAVHDPNGVLIDSRRESIPGAQVAQMYRTQQIAVMHDQLC